MEYCLFQNTCVRTMNSYQILFYTQILFLSLTQCLSSLLSRSSDEENLDLSTLISVTVVFRHGERAPDISSQYPSYPYKNVSFFPYNFGDLTREGQRRIINLGLELQSRYRAFLGDVYFNNLLNSTSSSYVRCQMSMQDLHAGLFWTRKWNPVPELPWQAVSYSIIPFDKDRYISVANYCPDLVGGIQYPDFKDNDQQTQEILTYLQENSGYDKVTYLQAMTIFDYTKTSLEMGLSVPSWLQSIYPQPLLTVGMKFWHLLVTQKLSLGVGALIQRITTDALQSLNKNGLPKMRIYSGHDLNIHFLLAGIGLWRGEYINYGACLLFELHQINEEYGFKIYMQNNYSDLRLLSIPDCGEFCPLTQFVHLTEHLYNPPAMCQT